MDRGLGAAGQHDVGAAEPDLVDGQGDALVARGARRDRCVHARPLAPTYRLMLAAGAFGISIGTESGETRRGPFSLRMSCWSSSVWTPPMPVAIATPRRSGSMSADWSRPESAQASMAATSANCAGAVEPPRLDALEHLGGLDRHRGRDLDRELLGPLLGRGRGRRTARRAGRPRSWARHRRRGRSCRGRSRRRVWCSWCVHLMGSRGLRGYVPRVCWMLRGRLLRHRTGAGGDVVRRIVSRSGRAR